MIIAPDDSGLTTSDSALKATVWKVFDGDGFLADVWHPIRKVWVERVPFRFAFIDAPELEQSFGPQSKDYLTRLIAGRTLRLDPVVKESTGYMPIDSYKRVLCTGFLTEQLEVGRVEYFRDGKCGAGLVKVARSVTRNIELEMIVNGWAWVAQQYSFDRQADYFAAQDDARLFRRGLWAANNPEPPWNFKRRQRLRNRASERQRRLI